MPKRNAEDASVSVSFVLYRRSPRDDDLDACERCCTLPGRLNGRLYYYYIGKMTIEALNCLMNSPTEDNQCVGGAGTHGDVLNEHTGTFPTYSRVRFTLHRQLGLPKLAHVASVRASEVHRK